MTTHADQFEASLQRAAAAARGERHAANVAAMTARQAENAVRRAAVRNGTVVPSWVRKALADTVNGAEATHAAARNAEQAALAALDAHIGRRAAAEAAEGARAAVEG